MNDTEAGAAPVSAFAPVASLSFADASRLTRRDGDAARAARDQASADGGGTWGAAAAVRTPLSPGRGGGGGGGATGRGPWLDVCSAQTAPRAALVVVLLTILLVAWQLLEGKNLTALLVWIDKEPLQGSALFVVLDALAIVVLCPGAVFALAAGAIFSLAQGTALVWLGTSLGQTLAFMVGRYLLRDAVVAWLAARFPKWPAIDAALSREGWKLVTLLRLSPLVPWNVLNYALSVTGVRLVPYALASSLAIVPWSLTFVYFGSLSRSLADVVDGHAGPDGLTAAAFLTASGALLIAALAYTTVISRRAIREALQAAAPEDGGDCASLLGGTAGETAVAADDVENAGAAGGERKAVPERRGSGFPSFSSL